MTILKVETDVCIYIYIFERGERSRDRPFYYAIDPKIYTRGIIKFARDAREGLSKFIKL